MATKAARNGRGNKVQDETLQAVPLARRARIVANRVQALQEQKLDLELVQIANDHDGSDPIPGEQPKQENGKVVYEDGQPVFVTYAERYAEYDAAEARLRKQALKLGCADLVETILEAQAAGADVSGGQ